MSEPSPCFWVFILFCAFVIYGSPNYTWFSFFPHDMFVFQQDRDSYLNMMQRPRTLGILPEGLADIWVVPETVILSLLWFQRQGEGSSLILHFWLQLPLFISDSPLG